jgi:hypothetical protein
MEFKSTEAFAALYLVKPQSVRSRYCREGSYFGSRPRKLANGRLLWPVFETPPDEGSRRAAASLVTKRRRS